MKLSERTMIVVRNNVPRPDVGLGVVRAEGVDPEVVVPGFQVALNELVSARANGLGEEEEQVRRSVRDMLRNGSYKPTGRGKPASEYLVRAAAEPGRDFPRINGPVDVCNYLSLKYLLPVSLWDLDRAEADRFRFRLGHSGESYVFNAAGQETSLEDLIVGCRVRSGDDEDGEPIINPVKDCLATKTDESTRRVAAGVYVPLETVPVDRLRAVCEEFASLLAACGTHVEVAYDVVVPGEERTI